MHGSTRGGGHVLALQAVGQCLGLWRPPLKSPKKANLVYNYLRRAIETGKYGVGDRIPTERNLTTEFKISRPTITAAIHRLVHEGLLRRNGKAGSVVMALPPRRTFTFGAILLMLGRQQQVESLFGIVGHEIAHRAGIDQNAVLLRDPSWGDDPDEPNLAMRYREIAGQFIQRQVAGAFVMPQNILPGQYVSATAAIAEDLKAAGIAVVLIDGDLIRYPQRSAFDLVGIDNFSAGYTLASHFIGLGCRKIDFFGNTARHPTQQARVSGYLQALADHGLPSDPAGVQYGKLHSEEFVIPTLRRRKPDAVLVLSDFRAASVMRFALQAGIKIPQDLRIGSFDDLPMAAHLSVPLTTVRQPAAGLGAAAYQVMLQRLAEPSLPPMHVQLSGELMVRESSGPGHAHPA